MYDVRPNLVIGFHGCDKTTRDTLVSNPKTIRISEEPYDWLGHGFYFWENDLDRAWMWAEEKKKRGMIKEPAVVGGIICLENCCDLIDSKQRQHLKVYYDALAKTYKDSNEPLPINRSLPEDDYDDRLLRDLDCTVIEFMHAEMNAQQRRKVNGAAEPFDSLRGAFREGAPLYNGAGFHEKTHIQLCIRNLNCIKAFFIPRTEVDFEKMEDEKYRLLEQKSLLN